MLIGKFSQRTRPQPLHSHFISSLPFGAGEEGVTRFIRLEGCFIHFEYANRLPHQRRRLGKLLQDCGVRLLNAVCHLLPRRDLRVLLGKLRSRGIGDKVVTYRLPHLLFEIVASSIPRSAMNALATITRNRLDAGGVRGRHGRTRASGSKFRSLQRIVANVLPRPK